MNNNKNEAFDLLEFLSCIIGCTYISDLRFEPYKSRAIKILPFLKFDFFSVKQIKDTFKYIYGKR